MMIGNPDRWWNRRVPILRIGAIAGFALIVFYTWAFYGDYIQNAVWSVCHQRTASFRGQKVQIPWFWREEEWTNFSEFQLTRSYLGTVFSSSVKVSYKNATPADVQKELDGERRLGAVLSQKSIGFSEVDDFSIPNFVCMDERFRGSATLFISCFSNDGRWNVRLIGLERSRPDLETILRGVTSMGNPSK